MLSDPAGARRLPPSAGGRIYRFGRRSNRDSPASTDDRQDARTVPYFTQYAAMSTRRSVVAPVNGHVEVPVFGHEKSPPGIAG